MSAAPLIAPLDLETTGFLEPEHRIIEVYIGLMRTDKMVWNYEQRVNPKRPIPADAVRVHGINTSDLVGKPDWETVGPIVHKILSKADFYMAHNAEFDTGFLKQELKRIGLELPNNPVICTMNGGLWATPDGKKPNMMELCYALDVSYDKAKAHAAAYDVEKMVECYWAGRRLGFYPVAEIELSAEAA